MVAHPHPSPGRLTVARRVIGRGRVTLELESGVDELLEALFTAGAKRVVEALERELDQIVEEARAAWPVGRDRGRTHSRDLFVVTLRLDPTGPAVEAVIENTAGRGTASKDYAYKIKSDGISPWQVHVVQRVKAAEQRLADLLAEELAKVFAGSTR